MAVTSSDTDPTTVDDQVPTFVDLGLSEPVLKALSDVGYETPSAIQAATIPTLLEGRDVVGLAQPDRQADQEGRLKMMEVLTGLRQ